MKGDVLSNDAFILEGRFTFWKQKLLSLSFGNLSYAILFFVWPVTYSFANDQNSQNIDNLIKRYNNCKTDTSRITLLNSILNIAPDHIGEKYNLKLKEVAKRCISDKNPKIINVGKENLAAAINNEGYFFDIRGDLEKALELYKQSNLLYAEIKNYQGEALTLNNIADLYQKQGDSDKAEKYFRSSLKIRLQINDKIGIAQSYGNLGFLNEQQGRYHEAIENYLQSLKISQDLNDTEGTGRSFINIGNVYFNGLEDYDKSIEYYRRSLKILQEKHQGLKAYAYDNIGGAYKRKYNSKNATNTNSGTKSEYLDSSIHFFSRSLKIREQIEDNQGIGYTLNNIGEIFYLKKEFSQSEKFLSDALNLRYKLNDKKEIAYSLISLSRLYSAMGQTSKAKNLALEGYKISNQIKNPERMLKSSFALFEIYKKEGNYKYALNTYTDFITIRDSLQNQDKKNQLIRQKFRLEYELKARSDSLLASEEKKLIDAKFKQEKTRRYALYGGVLILLVFGAVTFNRFYVTRKQKAIIQAQEIETKKQKDLLASKNAEILASIEYAQRIQSTILPSNNQFKSKFPESFVFYLPKDIVAGDFYWINSENYGKTEDIYLAVCDSTGHGVPGALVSLVCSKAIDSAYKDSNAPETGPILDRAAEIVTGDFSKNSENEDVIMDGMDASICRLNIKNKIIEWSGANHPLWVIYPGGNFVEFKPDKQPIGHTERRIPYQTHQIPYEEGMILYFSTDGFSDQFGGPENKKYQRKRFRDFILEISRLDIKIQGEKVRDEFIGWKGSEEQIDDVCVIGIRL